MQTLETLGISKMSVIERIHLAQEILESVAVEQPAAELSQAKKQELARRIADINANPDQSKPWSQVHAEALAMIAE
jgi:putative addiction module component (TIGR02574 family)